MSSSDNMPQYATDLILTLTCVTVSTWHNCTWLLNTALANRNENVLIDFFKKCVTTVTFSVTIDAVSYF